MPFELLIGLRYTRAKRRNHFISFISLISMCGTGLGVAVLIVVLSVMNGFQHEIRSRILGVAAHIQLTGMDGELGQWQRVAKEAERHPDVVAAAPYVLQQGLLSFGDAVRGVQVRGIIPDREEKVADFARYMRRGSLAALKPGEFGIILGIDLARALGAGVGDKVVLIAPQGLVTPAAVLPRLKQFRVVGIFDAGMFEYNAGLALVNIQDAQRLYRMGNDVTGVRLRLKDLFEAPRVAHELPRYVDADVYISDWTMSHANYFRAVSIEKNMMFIILLMIVAVAAFNIVSTLVMAVTDKEPDIAILRTLGASPRSIMQIFVIQGALIGAIGLVAGVVGGVLLAINIPTIVPIIEHTFHVHFLSPQVYYISELPSKLEWRDVIVTAVVSYAITLLATIYPSWRASRVNPAEALRYE